MRDDESRERADGSGAPREAEPRFEIRNRKSTPPAGASPSEVAAPSEVASPVEASEAAEVVDFAEPVEAAESAESSGPAPRRTRVGLGAWALLGVAVVTVVLAFFSWRAADDDPDRARAALRDSAVIEGTTAVETMNTMDHRDVPAGVKAWQDVSTGVLHDQLVAIGEEDKKLLADQGKVATGRVVQSALTELTDRTATLIVAVEVTVSGDEEGAEPTVKRNRFAADLVLVGDTWKLENLAQVPVGM